LYEKTQDPSKSSKNPLFFWIFLFCQKKNSKKSQIPQVSSFHQFSPLAPQWLSCARAGRASFFLANAQAQALPKA
jgi:hypothetical protein